MKRIYLSGPMTGIPDFNRPAFNTEAARLRALGYDVVNPAEINPTEAQLNWHECLRNDLSALLSCDTIAMLDGWMNSNGAHLEMHVAHRIGIKIVEAKDIGQASFNLVAHLHRQREFSERIFGPGTRLKGVLDHIRKELVEVEEKPDDVMEWIDIVLLALDGAWRSGHSPEKIAFALAEKQTRNEHRQWPDWRTSEPDKAIQHIRTGVAA